MAEEYEPFDSIKKSRIDDVLIPDLDDAVLRIARMRKTQVLKCKCEARNAVTNSVKYYSHVTVESEPVQEKYSLQGLKKYGEIDFSSARKMSAFSKELTSCLTEMNDLKKAQQLIPVVFQDESGKLQPQTHRFSRIKTSHMISVFH